MSYHPKNSEAFHILLTIFKIQMYYPHEEPGDKIFKFMQWFLVRTLTIFNFVGIGVHLTMSLKHGSYPVTIGDLSLGLGYISIFIGLLLFRKDHKLWAQFLRNLTEFKNFEKPGNYDTLVKRLNYLSLAGALYAIMGTYLYVRQIIVDHKPCQNLNKLYGLNELCGLPYPFWWPNELSSSQRRVICSFQVVSLLLSSISAMEFILFPMTIIEILKSRVEHFCKMLSTVLDTNCNEDEVKSKLNFCVEYHQYLTDLGRNFNKLYFSNFAHLSTAASIVTALILTQLLQMKGQKCMVLFAKVVEQYQIYKVFQIYNLGNVVHVGGWISGVFLVCRVGQMLEDMFLDISETAYFTKWEEMNTTNRKTILFLMMRTQKPIILTALPCGRYNYELYIALAKATYSYLTLMTQDK